MVDRQNRSINPVRYYSDPVSSFRYLAPASDPLADRVTHDW